MRSLLLKVIVSPIAVIVSSWICPNVDYANIWQAILVGLIIAVVGTAMEYLLLRRGTLWISTLADFVAALLVVFFVSNAFNGAEVTFWGAVLVSAIIAAAEVFTHSWLIRNGYTRKSPAH